MWFLLSYVRLSFWATALTKSGCALEEIFMNVIKSPYAEPRKTPVNKLCLGKNLQLNNVKNKVCQKFFWFQKWCTEFLGWFLFVLDDNSVELLLQTTKKTCVFSRMEMCFYFYWISMVCWAICFWGFALPYFLEYFFQ